MGFQHRRAIQDLSPSTLQSPHRVECVRSAPWPEVGYISVSPSRLLKAGVDNIGTLLADVARKSGPAIIRLGLKPGADSIGRWYAPRPMSSSGRDPTVIRM